MRRARSDSRMPELIAIGRRRKGEQNGARARVHIPLPSGLMGECEMGGGAWRRQFFNGFPAPCDLAEPGVYPTRVDAKRPIAGRRRNLGEKAQ